MGFNLFNYFKIVKFKWTENTTKDITEPGTDIHLPPPEVEPGHIPQERSINIHTTDQNTQRKAIVKARKNDRVERKSKAVSMSQKGVKLVDKEENFKISKDPAPKSKSPYKRAQKSKKWTKNTRKKWKTTKILIKT